MSTYLYELPTTGAISFAQFCIDQTANNSYTTHISDSTQARANLRDALKESKRADHGEKDYLKLVKARLVCSIQILCLFLKILSLGCRSSMNISRSSTALWAVSPMARSALKRNRVSLIRPGSHLPCNSFQTGRTSIQLAHDPLFQPLSFFPSSLVAIPACRPGLLATNVCVCAIQPCSLGCRVSGHV